MSARIAMAVAMGRILRKKREAEQGPVAPVPERETRPEPPPFRPNMSLIGYRNKGQGAPAENAHRETDALDLTDDEQAEVAPEPEAVVEPLKRHSKCGYPLGSIGCKNSHGDRA